MTTATFTSAEWKELTNAPHWIFGALTAAERGNIFTRRSEAKALKEFLSSYETPSALVKEIIARQEDADEKLEGSLEDAEKELGRVGALLEREVDEEEGDQVREFLMSAGEAVAEAAREGYRKAGVAVSPKEKEALAQIEIALKATAADKKRRHDAQIAADAARAAQEARAAEDAERRKQEEAQKKREAEAKAIGELEEARKRAAEAEAQKKAVAEEEAAAKARQEQIDSMRAASAMRAEEAKAKAAQEREEEEQKALEEEKARQEAEEAEKAEAEAKKAAERTYKVKKGDTLSGIAQKMYGDAGRWPEIFKANRDVIEDSRLIRPGWVLRIPD